MLLSREQFVATVFTEDEKSARNELAAPRGESRASRDPLGSFVATIDWQLIIQSPTKFYRYFAAAVLRYR